MLAHLCTGDDQCVILGHGKVPTRQNQVIDPARADAHDTPGSGKAGGCPVGAVFIKGCAEIHPKPFQGIGAVGEGGGLDPWRARARITF